VSHQTQDDGFHEIQLNGKQLVFLFIAATVVSVVIFLCGVLVGRGVRAGQSAIAEASTGSAVADTSPQQAAAAPVPTPAGSDPTVAPAPPAPADDLSYFDRLQKPNAPAEKLKPTPERSAAVVERPAPAAPRETPPPPAPKPAAPAPVTEIARAEPTAPRETPPPPAPKPAAQSPAPEAQRPEPAGQGFAVQIAALNVRSEADAIAKRLSSKGYAAYVLAPADGTPSVFRVRIGKFPTRREAETIAARLQKEEQFKPWVTR
jgi:cell division septation protein DedD